MAPRTKKKAAPKKKAPIKKKEVTEDNSQYVWIYGEPTIKEKCYEFHKDLQEHIEKAYLDKKPNCKVYIYGKIWVLDFAKMTEHNAQKQVTWPIKRVRTSQLKRLKCRGIAGTDYEVKPANGFWQDDDHCNVCYYKSTIPTHLSCGHVFCFQCLRCNYILGRDCPTCRTQYSREMFVRPTRSDIDFHMECPPGYQEDCAGVLGPAPKTSARRNPARGHGGEPEKYYWIYHERRRPGWFRFDPRSEYMIEESFKRKKKTLQIYICTFRMTINFHKMTQTSKDHRVGETDTFLDTTRAIKRIPAADYKKHVMRGIAGIRCLAYPID
ncbi:unnamed protein product [Caenorhabditis nigoni]